MSRRDAYDRIAQVTGGIDMDVSVRLSTQDWWRLIDGNPHLSGDDRARLIQRIVDALEQQTAEVLDRDSRDDEPIFVPAPIDCEQCGYRLNINGTCPNHVCRHRKIPIAAAPPEPE